MITLTRLSGSVFALNSDLIERVDATPDTVITLVDGTKYVVREPLPDVVDAIREYRGAVIAESARMGAGAEVASANPPSRRLVAVPDDPDELLAQVAPLPQAMAQPQPVSQPVSQPLSQPATSQAEEGDR